MHCLNNNKKILKSTELLDALKERKGEIEVLMTIGASDIDKYHNRIIETLKEN